MCCVLGVGDEMFICGQGTGIYAVTRDDTIWEYLVVRYCMAGRFMSVCSAVDVCERGMCETLTIGDVFFFFFFFEKLD